MSEDFLELLSAFIAADARFLVVGAYAVGVHAFPSPALDEPLHAVDEVVDCFSFDLS